jgi:hypothetical protein
MRHGREPADSAQSWTEEFRSALFTRRVQPAQRGERVKIPPFTDSSQED